MLDFNSFNSFNSLNHSLTASAVQMRESLRADCGSCFGLCCTALHIVSSSDFAMDKAPGVPCHHLQTNYRCGIHGSLREKGFKGCTVFDCMGAGQWVSQVTFKGRDWRENAADAETMFRVFPVVEQLHEMIAYAAEALSYKISGALQDRLLAQLEELIELTKLAANSLLVLDIMAYRKPLNILLVETSEFIRQRLIEDNPNRVNSAKLTYRGVDWAGKKLKGKDLRAYDLRGALLIAADLQNADLRGADLIGADMRDAQLSGADLSTAMFLTQMQVNSAKGNSATRLPVFLQRPSHWGH